MDQGNLERNDPHLVGNQKDREERRDEFISL